MSNVIDARFRFMSAGHLINLYGIVAKNIHVEEKRLFPNSVLLDEWDRFLDDLFDEILERNLVENLKIFIDTELRSW